MQVEINGTLAELGNSTPTITRKSIDINNPSARFVDFTNRFDLPDTLINRQIFDSPAGIGTNNRSFDKLYNVIIRDVFQIFEGKGFLDSTKKDVFSFQCVDNSKDLFNAIDKPLRSVNWDDEDTILTQTAINALDSVDIDTCWFWGKACYHENALTINTDQTTGDERCKYSRPSLYVNGLLARAIENGGYTFTVPVPELALSVCHSEFWFTSYQKTITSIFTPSGTLALSGLNINDFAHADLTVASGNIDIAAKKTIFRLRGQSVSSSIVNLIIRATDNVDPTKVSESKLVLSGTEDIDFSSSEFQSDDGMTIDIRLEGTGNITFSNMLLYTILSDKEADLSTNPWLGYKIKAYDNLPDLTYLDLYRLICVTSNKTHLITSARKFSFRSMSSLNKLASVDWSEKFIIGSDTVTSKFDGLFQKNWLKYENDLTVSRELGQAYFLTDNESLEAEGSYLELKFSASNECQIGSNLTVHVRVYNDTTRITDQEIKPRLFVINSDKLQFLSWQTIADTYYSNFFNCLNRVRVIECDMNLSKLDVLSWYENQVVYIDYFKSSFIVLEINNFISGRKTRVKILNYGR
jgi:hypothetical protein